MSDDRPAIEYFFSFSSLWSYVGSRVFQDIVRRTGVRVDYKPIDLHATFEAGGSKRVRDRPAPRQLYRIVEMLRWRDRHKIPLTIWPKYYPVEPGLGHRMLLAALRAGQDVAAFAHNGMQAVWADDLDVADPASLVAIADRSGLDGRALLAAADDDAITAREQEITREAADRHLFGAPFYFYRGEPFWGQDRLEMLEEMIVSGRAPVTWPELREIDPSTATIR
jgi:2-hydroxychromene-2-carboxylate isomerase